VRVQAAYDARPVTRESAARRSARRAAARGPLSAARRGARRPARPARSLFRC